MRGITPELTSELNEHFKDPNKVASGEAFRVSTFRELMEYTAKLSYLNKDHLLFYRGQRNDYRNRAGNSTFYPTIYRGDYLKLSELRNKFDILDGAGKALVELFETEKIDGYKDVKKREYIQWSILQHYEVCDTPLIDFTHSLRVACSFALMDNDSGEAYVYIFGMPYFTNRISINSEHDIVNIRLLSICPPGALRPYFQEGYLIGTDGIKTNYESKTELDFNNRLIAKFKIPTDSNFWGEGFHKIPEGSLYPDNDPIKTLCDEIRVIARQELKSGDMGEFLKRWADIEEWLLTHANKLTLKHPSILEAVRILHKNGVINDNHLYPINYLRTFRNRLVHEPKIIEPKDVIENIERAEDVLGILKMI